MSAVDQIRAIVGEQLDNRPHIGTVYSVGVSTIAVRLFATGTIIEDVPVAGGGVSSLASGDPVYLLYFDEDNSVLALSAKAVVGGEFVGGAPSAHSHPALYYTRGEMDAILLTKEDKATNNTPQWIEAIGGNIGGWLIESNRLIKDTGTNATSSGMVPGEYPFYSGATYDNRATATFRVSQAGAITATSGVIGGWTLGTTTLSATGIVLDAGNQKITVGASAPNMVIDGANKYIRTSTYAAGLQGFNLDGATGDAEFNNISARGALKVTTLQYGQILATNGSVIIPKATGVVRDDFTSVDDPMNGLLAYWLMGEATGAARVDSVAGLSLAVNGTVSQVAGKQGNAAGAIGSPNYLSIADNATMSTGDIDFTFAGWVYLTTKTATRALFSKANAADAAGTEYELEYGIGTDRFVFRVSNGTTQSFANSNSAPAIGTWYFVVCWHDSVNNVIGIQVDNGAAATTAHTGGAQDSAFPFEVFRAFGSTYSDGRVDELAFWKRILTAQEKTFLYNNGTGVTYPIWGLYAVNIKDPDGLSHAAAGSLWAFGDIVRIKEPLTGDLWSKVLGVTDNTTFWLLTLEKTSPGSGTNYTFRKGVAALNYGQSGAGLIMLSSDETLGASPNMTMATHAGQPWNALTPLLRTGNLANSYGYGAGAVYGVGMGQYGAASQASLTIDTTNGIRLFNNTTVIGQWDTAGNMALGQVATNSGNLYWNNTTKKLLFRGGTGGTVMQVEIGTDGKLYAGGGKLVMDSTGITMDSVGAVSYLQWKFGATQTAQINANYSNGIPYNNQLSIGLGTIAGYSGTLELSAGAPTTYWSRVNIEAFSGGSAKGELVVMGEDDNANGSGVWATVGGFVVGSTATYAPGTGNAIITGGLNVGTATGAGTGEVRASERVSADGQGAAFALRQNVLSIANNAVAQLGKTASFFGLVTVMNTANGRIAVYEIQGGAHVVAEVTDLGGVFTPTAGNAGTTNIYWSVGNARYEIENKTGGSVNYNIYYVGATAS